MKHLLIAIALAVIGVAPATARVHHSHHANHHRQYHHHYAYHSFHHSSSGVIGGRPSGCPHAFCGCGASLYLFHKIIPALNLAANWFRFPRAYPAPNMVAVRRHHVFVLVHETERPGVWVVHDSNSGGGRTRLHERSIAGYAIRNPYG
jgi:hypothetical protein